MVQTLHLNGTEAELFEGLCQRAPGARAALDATKHIRGEIRPYQRALLYLLTQAYDRRGAVFLELGTFLGNTAAIMAEAAPQAAILTLNVKAHEVKQARLNLKPWPQVHALEFASRFFLEAAEGTQYDVIFVDGDHKNIRYDLPWIDHLRPGGLMLFHDYSPKDARVACVPVYDALNEFAEMLGRPLDVAVADTDKLGMAGIYKREGDTWKR